jgi:hypothetical protein
VTGGRLKLLLLAVVASLASVALLAWSQSWFTIRVADAEFGVGGEAAAGALPPLALATLALVAALAIAGPFFRVVLAVLESLLGVCVVLVAVVALADPAVASASVVSERTGVSVGSAPELVESAVASAWPAVAIAAGAIGILAGIAILMTQSRWPAAGRKYDRTRLTAADPVDAWDALSKGDDPTTTEAR